MGDGRPMILPDHYYRWKGDGKVYRVLDVEHELPGLVIHAHAVIERFYISDDGESKYDSRRVPCDELESEG
jgi:hypothetical protein